MGIIITIMMMMVLKNNNNNDDVKIRIKIITMRMIMKLGVKTIFVETSRK